MIQREHAVGTHGRHKISPPTILRMSTLLSEIVCPRCQNRFSPENVLWISEHVELRGDDRLGLDAPGRFAASHFTPEGDAIDAKGLTARRLACPNCRLEIPRVLVDTPMAVVATVGAERSGKSFLLAAATWQMRRVLPEWFGLSFSDTDGAVNRRLAAMEAALFLNAHPRRIIAPDKLIPETPAHGQGFDVLAYGRRQVELPSPFLFTLRPQAGHPNVARAARVSRVLALYDTAGNHFLAGAESADCPATGHLGLAKAIVFLFDPVQDPRFRDAARIRDRSVGDARSARQDLMLAETASRVRRLQGRSETEPIDRPLIVVVSKFDRWSRLFREALSGQPWRHARGSAIVGMDLQRIETLSGQLRDLLRGICPEIVASAEAMSSQVTYMPAGVLGDRVEIDPTGGGPGIRPGEIRPHWAAAPYLYALCRTVPGLVPRVGKRRKRVAR